MLYFLILIAAIIVSAAKSEPNKTLDKQSVASNNGQVLPYVLRTSNMQDIKGYGNRFAAHDIGSRQKPDLLDVEEEKKEMAVKPARVELQNWDRVAHYAHTPYDALQTWSNQGHALSGYGHYGPPAIPTTLLLLLNLGILSYVVIGVLSALNRIIAAASGYYSHGGGNGGHSFGHFRNREDESFE